MKTHLFFLLFFVLFIQACSIPGRFGGSHGPVPVGMMGTDLSYTRSFNQDTSNYQAPSLSLGLQFQSSEKWAINFGFVNLVSPYAGFDYRILKWGESSLKTGFNIGLLDGMLAIPLKANFALNDRFKVELNMRYAGNLYKRNYDVNEGNFIFLLYESSLAPWYLGFDTGLNVQTFKNHNIGVRIGHYWYRNVSERKVDRLWFIGVNTMLITQRRRLRLLRLF